MANQGTTSTTTSTRSRVTPPVPPPSSVNRRVVHVLRVDVSDRGLTAGGQDAALRATKELAGAQPFPQSTLPLSGPGGQFVVELVTFASEAVTLPPLRELVTKIHEVVPRRLAEGEWLYLVGGTAPPWYARCGCLPPLEGESPTGPDCDTAESSSDWLVVGAPTCFSVDLAQPDSAAQTMPARPDSGPHFFIREVARAANRRSLVRGRLQLELICTPGTRMSSPLALPVLPLADVLAACVSEGRVGYHLFAEEGCLMRWQLEAVKDPPAVGLTSSLPESQDISTPRVLSDEDLVDYGPTTDKPNQTANGDVEPQLSIPDRPLHELAWEAFQEQLPALLKDFDGQWVGYLGSERVKVAADDQDVLDALGNLGVPPNQQVIYRIESRYQTPLNIIVPTLR